MRPATLQARPQDARGAGFYPRKGRAEVVGVAFRHADDPDQRRILTTGAIVAALLLTLAPWASAAESGTPAKSLECFKAEVRVERFSFPVLEDERVLKEGGDPTPARQKVRGHRLRVDRAGCAAPKQQLFARAVRQPRSALVPPTPSDTESRGCDTRNTCGPGAAHIQGKPYRRNISA